MKSIYHLFLLHSCMLLLSFAFLPGKTWSQVIPEAGEVQCFLVGTGGVMTDPGGPGGSDVAGSPGNYPDCDCVTTTTLCPVDGSALTVDFSSFGVGVAFDWLVILDGDNPDGEQYPYSILDDPANTSYQLFNNSNGNASYGGADNYGQGVQIGVGSLLQMGSTSYTATNATGCLTFVFRASGTINKAGWEALIFTADGAGHPGDDIGCDVSISCLPPGNPYVFNITPNSVDLSWNPVAGAQAYLIEYGPSGFIPGSGTFISTVETTFTLDNLEENTYYDVYLYTDCGGGDISLAVGPLEFNTPWVTPPTVCTYTLELYDSFGDGWNGAQLEVNINGNVSTYTLASGDFASFAIEVLEGVPVVLTYYSGFYEAEVSYTLFDADGNPVFSDGPFPATGEVYHAPAFCPACPPVLANTIQISDITSSSANVSWDDNGAAQQYIVEYGPAGFPQGVGLTVTTTDTFVTLTGLNALVDYDVYVYADCGENGYSSVAGPFSFQTLNDGIGGPPCIYTLQLHDSYGDGWNGAFITVEQGGVATNYTIDFTNPDLYDATYEVVLISNLPVTFSYTPGFFENEVTFEILDSDGNVIYEDGPSPQTGVILELIACPLDCTGPFDFQTVDVNADNVIFSWSEAMTPGQYLLEYGPLGFTLGAGTEVNLTNASSFTASGLEEGTYYNAYLSYLCDNSDLTFRLGPLTFRTLWLNDVGISDIFSPAESDCNLSAAEAVTVGLHNYGQNPQSLIPFFYAVNGVEAPIPFPVDGFYTGVVSNDSTEVIDFETLYDFSVAGYYLIEAWTELETDSKASNDTTRIELITAEPLPLVEDFESGELAEGWTSSSFNPIFAPGSHNNPTTVCGVNLYSFVNSFFLQTNRVGPLGSSETLTFEYRYVDWFSGTNATILGEDDKLEVLISVDCGVSWIPIYTIDSLNHTPTTDFTEVSINLAAFAGQAIDLRFEATWGSGDYWLDLDNINITGCPATFVLSADIQPATGEDANGSIALSQVLGVAPFTYIWDNGMIGPVISGLPAGSYSVTVTDANGCQEVATYTVGSVVSTQTPDFIQRFSLAPNPTAGNAVMDLTLRRALDLEVDVFSALGQNIAHYEQAQAVFFRQEIDLSGQPAGLYYLRIRAGENVHLAKLLLVK